MTICSLWARLFGRRQSLTLTVDGTITEQGRHQPRTRLGPEQAAEEAWFALEISRARLSDGADLPTESIRPNEFSGDIALLERFDVGDQVRIHCTTATGRLISMMEQRDAHTPEPGA